MEALPNVASDLIDVAVNDLEACNVDPRYTVNMTVWHAPSRKDNGRAHCRVCLAGAVMAKRLGVAPDQLRLPGEFGDGDYNRLSALNHFRNGAVYVGLSYLDPDFKRAPGVPETFSPGDPEDSFVGFCTGMRRLASRLRRVGL